MILMETSALPPPPPPEQSTLDGWRGSLLLLSDAATCRTLLVILHAADARCLSESQDSESERNRRIRRAREIEGEIEGGVLPSVQTVITLFSNFRC